MKTSIRLQFVLVGLLTAFSATAEGFKLNTADIEKTTGLKGTLNASEGVFKDNAPRNDLPFALLSPRMPLNKR